MDQNEWENARVSMDFKLLAHHYMDLDHPNLQYHQLLLCSIGSKSDKCFYTVGPKNRTFNNFFKNGNRAPKF